jgi:hypothetical protein
MISIRKIVCRRGEGRERTAIILTSLSSIAGYVIAMALGRSDLDRNQGV